MLEQATPFRLCSRDGGRAGAGAGAGGGGGGGNTTVRRPYYLKRKFSIRHNPQPLLVKHFSGLQNAPICRVGSHHKKKVQQSILCENTLTNLPIIRLKDIPPIEKAIPQLGIVSIREPWRLELKALTESIVSPLLDVYNRGDQWSVIEHHPYPICRPVTVNYSRRTPTPNIRLNSNASQRSCVSRSSCCSSSRASSRPFYMQMHKKEDLSQWAWNENWEQDYESQVLSLIGQLLQVSEIDDVKRWLANATDQEKAAMIRILESVFQSQMETEKKKEQNQQAVTERDNIINSDQIADDTDSVVPLPPIDRPAKTASSNRIRPQTSSSIVSSGSDRQDNRPQSSGQVLLKYKVGTPDSLNSRYKLNVRQSIAEEEEEEENINKDNKCVAELNVLNLDDN